MNELKLDRSIAERARHDNYLFSALDAARAQGLEEKEAYIATIHMLLDIKDEVIQERFDEAMWNIEPPLLASLEKHQNPS